jgi:hypothetical protein
MMLPSQSDQADPTADDGTVPSRSDQAVPAANIVMPKLSCRCYIAYVVVPIFPCHADPTADESYDESWCRTEPIRPPMIAPHQSDLI